MKINIVNKLACWMFVAIATISVSSCTKYANPDSVFEEYELPEDTTIMRRKVLVIAVDGLVGAELKKEVPKNIAGLLEHAKYSFESIADENTTDAASWASLMTGVGSSLHHITTNSFLPTPDPDHPHDEEAYFPSVFYRVSEQAPRLSTLAVTQEPGLANIMLMDAGETALVTNDQAAADKIVKEVSQGDPDFMLVQFTSVLKAGTASSFSYESKEYKAAVNAVDNHVGVIVAAVQERPSFDREEWLIVLTSNHGGIGNSYGGPSFQERNTVTIFNHKNFVSQELKADVFVAPRFFGYDVNDPLTQNAMRGRNTVVPQEEIQYNIANTGEITIEAKIKVNKNASGNYSYSYPPFLSKTNARTGSTNGWSLFRAGNNVNFWVADGGVSMEISGGPVAVDEEWAHITGIFTRVEGVPTVKLYVNGTQVATKAEPTMNVGSIESLSALTFGFQQEVFSTNYLDQYMSDVHIWNVALSDEEVVANARSVGIAANHPRIANLVGYWPLDDGGDVFQNKVEGMPDIPVWGKASYDVFASNLPHIAPENAILFKSRDLMPQVLYWLNIDVRDNWGIEGQNYLKNFEIEFLK
ncbi:DUF4983 domain-containing protein [Sphingobacterium shayense]|uniref:LamG-like jellyroll fold domain-containing protein n=1 Tax=Sphingobacterium shayense TaxID=626343 RepID=UPI001557B2BC|nr:LamG-like jellyroll fold domain-containing protein [Sphingobacterium shayense]NQD71969.1 DUF4983 domain-containing protein [Sphingobacterium shayense]